jgi:hypothetical protein
MKISRKLALSLILFIVLVFSLLYSIQVNQANDGQMQMHNNAKDMKQEILKSIPIGSSLTNAQKLMDANGFRCSKQEQGNFLELDTENMDYGILHNNIKYLYCDKELSAESFCSRRWQIALVFDGNTVSDIIVSVGKSCL